MNLIILTTNFDLVDRREIYCINEPNSIIDFHGLILVNLNGGILVYSLNSKQVIQFIEKKDNWGPTSILKSTTNDDIFIYNKFERILMKYEYKDTLFIPIEEIEIIKCTDEKLDESKDKLDLNILIALDKIIFWADKIHILIKDENSF